MNEKSIYGSEIINNAAKILFVSEFAADYAKKGTPEQNAKMGVLPNAIDVARFDFDGKEKIRKETREKLGINENDIVVLFVGRMVKDKGALELIKSFSLLKTMANVKILLIGGATYSSNKKTAYVNDCLNAAKQNPDIIFLGDVKYSDIVKYYAAADISTLLSKCNEACGLVGIESMAAGLPIITTDRGGIPEYVCDSCKITVKDGDCLEIEIASAIDKLADNANLRKEMGKCGFENAKSFDKSAYYQNFKKMVYSVVNECKKT